ncbi:MAG TPA: hypothetical protein VJ874_04535, partial [Candidatus Thermoplasmatota archaeon]|nr:hypothetical protein [Candidatus Thermoplasmatota archaeon]
MKGQVLAAALVLVLAAGCAGSSQPDDPADSLAGDDSSGVEEPGSPARPSPTNRPTTGRPDSADPVLPSGPLLEPEAPARPWRQPVAVYSNDYVSEPMVAVDSQGTIYYAPNSNGQGPFRSTDGGLSFQEIPPDATLPTQRSDASVSIAPDDSLWYSRSSLDLGSTMGCTSLTRGDSWTCSDIGIPGFTDRMWIVGLDAATGYLQAVAPHLNPGAQAPVPPTVFYYSNLWSKTTTGSVAYVPFATVADQPFPAGNMVYDAKLDAVFQIESRFESLWLSRIDTATGIVSWRDTHLAPTMALPWLAATNGTLWTTANPVSSDGSTGVVLGRSTDGGATWKAFAVPTTAKSATFSYVAAAPDGRVGLVFYGSPAAGNPASNEGPWDLYVLETANAFADAPRWRETILAPVHVGGICISFGCESAAGDPHARFSLDLIGIAIDGNGDLHVAYVQDLQDHVIE